MKTTILALLLTTLPLAAGDDKPCVMSPNHRYVVRLHQEAEATYPLILLRDTRTGEVREVFNYGSVGQMTTRLHAVWSPDSRYVALTLAMGPATQEVAVYRIANSAAREVKMLPIPKALDAPVQGHRGGPTVDHWEDSRTLWISDSQKNRSFRYRLTKQGKLLADGFKDDEPE